MSDQQMNPEQFAVWLSRLAASASQRFPDIQISPGERGCWLELMTDKGLIIGRLWPAKPVGDNGLALTTTLVTGPSPQGTFPDVAFLLDKYQRMLTCLDYLYHRVEGKVLVEEGLYDDEEEEEVDDEEEEQP